MHSRSVVLDFSSFFFLPLQFISTTYVRGYFYFKRGKKIGKKKAGESLRQVQRQNNRSIVASLILPPASRLLTLISLIMRINTSAVWLQLNTNARREKDRRWRGRGPLLHTVEELDENDMKNH